MRIRAPFAVLLALAAAACAGRDPKSDSLPVLVFSGSAEGQHPTEDIQADCQVGLQMSDLVETETGYAGTVGGEVFRNVVVGTSGGGFQALLAGEGTIEEGPATATLRLFGDQTGGAPFWLALEVLSGTPAGELSWAGAFECAPLDTQLGPGVLDTGLTISGTWTLAPL